MIKHIASTVFKSGVMGMTYGSILNVVGGCGDKEQIYMLPMCGAAAGSTMGLIGATWCVNPVAGASLLGGCVLTGNYVLRNME